MKNTITPYGLRISDEMKNFVRSEALNNRRSMNKQIEFWIQEKMEECNVTDNKKPQCANTEVSNSTTD